MCSETLALVKFKKYLVPPTPLNSVIDDEDDERDRLEVLDPTEADLAPEWSSFTLLFPCKCTKPHSLLQCRANSNQKHKLSLRVVFATKDSKKSPCRGSLLPDSSNSNSGMNVSLNNGILKRSTATCFPTSATGRVSGGSRSSCLEVSVTCTGQWT